MTQQTVWAELVELYEYRVADVRAGGRPRGGMRALGELRARLQGAPLDPALARRLRTADRLYRAYRAAQQAPAETPAAAPEPQAVGTPDPLPPADPAEVRAWAELGGLRWERELRAELEARGREWLAQRGQPALRVLHAAAESAEREARGQSGAVAVPAAGDPLAALDRPSVARDLLHAVAAQLLDPSGGWGRLRAALLALEAEPLRRHADADVLAAHLRAAEREPLAPAARAELVRALRETRPTGPAEDERPLLREAAAEVRRQLEALMQRAPAPRLDPGSALPPGAILYAVTPRAARAAPPDPEEDTLTVHLAGGRAARWRGLHLSWERVGASWQLRVEGPGGQEVALLHPARPAAERVQTLALGPLLPEDAALRLSLSGDYLRLEWLRPPGPGLADLAAQARLVAALLRPEEGYAGLRLARAVAGLLRGAVVDVSALGPSAAARYAAAPPAALLTVARKGAAALHARAARLGPQEWDALLEEAGTGLGLGDRAVRRLRAALLAAQTGVPRSALPMAGGEATLPEDGTFTRLRLPRDPHLVLRAAGTELEVRPALGGLSVQPSRGQEGVLSDLLVLSLPQAQVLLVRALEDIGGAVLSEAE